LTDRAGFAAPGARPAWIAALLLLLLGCGPAFGDEYLLRFRAAQRALHAGRYEEAAQLFGEAARLAERVKDRDEAHFMQARMYEKLRSWNRARERYRHIVTQSPNGTRAGRAAFELATLDIEHGNAERGWSEVARAIERYPNHGSARRGLTLWAEHTAESAGEEALRARLVHWQKTLSKSALAQQLAYELGLSFERSGKLEQSHATLLRAARDHPYPKGTLTDDAFYRASLVAEKLGKPELAIANLREMLAVRERADFLSYERPRMPHAQMRIAELYRDRMGDLRAARREFVRMYKNHGDSDRADDAMWQVALISRRLSDRDEACVMARALTTRKPLSRYRRCARELCPALSPLAGERPCPTYLARQLDGDNRL
jgi:TolA-binding protein